MSFASVPTISSFPRGSTPLENKNNLSSFENLPRDVLLKIFSSLSLLDLASCTAVSRTIREAALDNSLWSSIARRRLGIEAENPREAIIERLSQPSFARLHAVLAPRHPRVVMMDVVEEHYFPPRIDSAIAPALQPSSPLTGIDAPIIVGNFILRYIATTPEQQQEWGGKAILECFCQYMRIRGNKQGWPDGVTTFQQTFVSRLDPPPYDWTNVSTRHSRLLQTPPEDTQSYITLIQRLPSVPVEVQRSLRDSDVEYLTRLIRGEPCGLRTTTLGVNYDFEQQALQLEQINIYESNKVSESGESVVKLA